MLWCVDLHSKGLRQFVGQRYALLFMHLLQQEVLALGLYRFSQSSDRDKLPYDYCAPKHDLVLRSDDRVFVLASSRWAEDHDSEYSHVMLERAVLCLQSHWRGHCARRSLGRVGFRSKQFATGAVRKRNRNRKQTAAALACFLEAVFGTARTRSDASSPPAAQARHVGPAVLGAAGERGAEPDGSQQAGEGAGDTPVLTQHFRSTGVTPPCQRSLLTTHRARALAQAAGKWGTAGVMAKWKSKLKQPQSGGATTPASPSSEQQRPTAEGSPTGPGAAATTTVARKGSITSVSGGGGSEGSNGAGRSKQPQQ